MTTQTEPVPRKGLLGFKWVPPPEVATTYYSRSQACAALSVSDFTLRKLIERGDLHSITYGVRGYVLVSKASVTMYIQSQLGSGLPAPVQTLAPARKPKK